ncbi:MAG TPA: hypothetical protein VLA56_04355 [Pseudomonadales bacterium]|nr:hypothetical protein [Pseudomonadales bacterium]
MAVRVRAPIDAARRDRPACLGLPRLLLAAVLLPVLFACAGEAAAPADPPESVDTSVAAQTPSPAADEDLQACGEVRPQICTREYRPVCALRDTGVRCVTAPCDEASEWVTRPNACEACADAAVIAHRPGTCEGGAMPGSAPLDL